MKKLYLKDSITYFAILILVIGCSSPQKKNASRVEVLPYYNEPTYTPNWIAFNEVPNDFHQVPKFRLINQNGDSVTEQDLNNKITVADFFFTTCPGICPKMTSNMTIVQDEFLRDDDIVILSHSVTPEFDSVAILKEYALNKGIVKKEWHLLTGSRDVIYDLGRNQYFVEEDLGLEKDADDFIHTENFVLIDQKRRIRGIYNGLNKSSINQLIADIKTLRKKG